MNSRFSPKRKKDLKIKKRILHSEIDGIHRIAGSNSIYALSFPARFGSKTTNDIFCQYNPNDPNLRVRKQELILERRDRENTVHNDPYVLYIFPTDEETAAIADRPTSALLDYCGVISTRWAENFHNTIGELTAEEKDVGLFLKRATMKCLGGEYLGPEHIGDYPDYPCAA